MKRLVLWVFVCTMGVAAQAVLIDDFGDTGLSEYIQSTVLVNGTGNTTTFLSPAGTLQVSKSGTAAHQNLLLRDDYSLGVGDTLRVDISMEVVTYNCDFGIAVSLTKDPVDAVPSGTTLVDNRRDFLDMYIKAGSNGWGCLGFNGTTQVANSGYVTAQDISLVTGLFISRTADTVFDVGYTTAAGDVVFRTLTVPSLAGAYNAVGIYSDLRSTATVGNIDNLRIWSILYEAHDPDPANNAAMVGTPIGTTGFVDVTLGWKAGIDPDGVYEVNPVIKKHYVFLSKDQTVFVSDPNLYYVAAVDQLSLTDPNAEYVADPPLRSGGLYLWTVEEGLDDGLGGVYGPGDPNNIPGRLWTFETISTIPVIQTQPSPATVVLNTTADPAFTIDVFSTTTAHYQWYYSADDLIGSDTPVGSDQPTLAIANAQMSDQGYYYCRVWNSATVSGGGTAPDVNSTMVTLTIGRLVAAYTFDNTLNDTSGEGNHGSAKDLSLPDPNLAVLTFPTDRIQGTHSIQLDGVGQYVNFGMAAYPKAGPLAAGVGSGLNEGTITCWVKASKVGGLLTNYNDGTTTGFAMSLETSGDTADARINARGEATEITTAQGRPGMTGYDILTDNTWHMVTVVWKAGTSGIVYVDGGQVASDDAMGTPALYAAWQRGVLLGATRTLADRDVLTNFYGGLIDDLRVYNYVRTPEQIANEYYTVTGNPACTEPGFEGSAYNFDNTISSYCRIDLADFAVFVQSWLADGLSTGQ
jgi:hypothetical protein